jgi:hypothetical protein
MMIRYASVIILIAFSISSLNAAIYYVSPKGSDKGAGTAANPFMTIAKACSVMKAGDTCYLKTGVYRETLKPLKSGTNSMPITFASAKGHKAVISGADLLTGWKKEGDVYTAPMAWTMDVPAEKKGIQDGDQLFIDGEMTSEARWPSTGSKLPDFLFTPNRAGAQGGGSTNLNHAGLGDEQDGWKGAHLWCAGGQSWICWTEPVLGYDAASKNLTFARDYILPGPKYFYKPRGGSKFSLRYHRKALDDPGEWFLDKKAKKMLFIPPSGKDINSLKVAAKRRQHCIDLSGLSYIRVMNIDFRGGGIQTDNKSSHNTFEKLTGKFVSHSWSKDVGSKYGVQLRGTGHLLVNCDLSYSSAAVVSTAGSDHRIINNKIQYGGYGALWNGTVRLTGRRILFSHNTVAHAGRDLINIHGLSESLVQYNDVSNAGYLTADLGMIYGHTTDFANTEFCYNWIHDNRASAHRNGIYFDHVAHNAIVHHNVLWNIKDDPLRLNNPAYCGLVFNNSCLNTGAIGTFDHAGRNDLHATRFMNNLVNKKIGLPGHVAMDNNVVNGNPPYKDPRNKDFTLTDSSLKAGAYTEGIAWKAGCDLSKTLSPLPVYRPANIPWMNIVKNSCFEFADLEGWTKTGAKKAEMSKGNYWGTPWNGKPKQPLGTGVKELQLGPGKDGVSQLITGLTPNTEYKLSGWLKTANGETVELAVNGHGGDAVLASHSGGWTRKTIDFKTGSSGKQVTISVTKTSSGSGNAWADALVLPTPVKLTGIIQTPTVVKKSEGKQYPPVTAEERKMHAYLVKAYKKYKAGQMSKVKFQEGANKIAASVPGTKTADIAKNLINK